MSPRIVIIGPGSAVARYAMYVRLEGADPVGVSPEGPTSCPAMSVFHSPELMLDRLRPDGAVVLTDPPSRAKYIEAALEAGCHVLCAEPIVYDPGVSVFECLDTATRLRDLSQQRQLHLCAMSPMVALAPALRELADLGLGPARGVWSFVMRDLRPPCAGTPSPASRLLAGGSGPLALLLALVPGARVIEHGIQASLEPQECRIAFDCYSSDAASDGTPHQCAVSIVLGQATTAQTEVEVNGLRMRYEERWAPDGTRPGYLSVDEHEAPCGDLTQLTVRAFLSRIEGQEAGPIPDADHALASLRVLLRLLRQGSGSAVAPMTLRVL